MKQKLGQHLLECHLVERVRNRGEQTGAVSGGVVTRGGTSVLHAIADGLCIEEQLNKRKEKIFSISIK